MKTDSKKLALQALRLYHVVRDMQHQAPTQLKGRLNYVSWRLYVRYERRQLKAVRYV